MEFRDFFISSAVPCATTSPPPAPALGPISIYGQRHTWYPHRVQRQLKYCLNREDV